MLEWAAFLCFLFMNIHLLPISSGMLISEYFPYLRLYMLKIMPTAGLILHIVLQVSLWDAIIPAKEFAKFSIHTSNKYRFIDQVRHPLWLIFLILYKRSSTNLSNFLFVWKIQCSASFIFLSRDTIFEVKNSTWHCTGTSCPRPARCLPTK